MLKSITRRRKKYIFLDYLIVLLTAMYLRIRSVDMDFYSSLQPNYLWLLTILFGLMFAKIGRVWCIFICVIMNLFSIYFLSSTTHVVFVSSIYKMTYDSLILLVIGHTLYLFRERAVQALTYCYSYLELAQLFMNLKYFKYFLFLLIVSLSTLRLRCRSLPTTNYFIVIKHLCTARMAVIILILFLQILLTTINLNTFVGAFTSSLARYIILFLYPFYFLPLIRHIQYTSESLLILNVAISGLFLFDQLAVFLVASIFIPIIFIVQFTIFIYIFREIDPKISRTIKYINYDAVVLINYIILRYAHSNYESFTQHKTIIYFLSAIIAIFLFIRNKNICKSFTNKQNYYNNTYDQFESARNDDTVL
ncbi:unnamed protein product (macronuclear) [Paramecium tetraurelia]|uniref:GPI ethanolamine phosphate transferase 1 n=1 Tax=Paramecium tetraurelia TaxID=5888 RepID=A0D883_PARTE|nr:uncharacterized protein GSPATT00014217001 [Paramecium tetraurelia]CAK79250.1 unnamed protein product [Paramecium tetraurelia]|eukprot:XP_001446647.1 hypothetical protein (macronuclear) [Paramecium tetraurelia strain d4-2]